MSIHPTHSKRSLCEIVEIFELNIEDYLDLDKKSLQFAIIQEINSITDIKTDQEYFFIKDVKELKHYLKKADQRKLLTVKEKDIVMLDAKKIIYYCKSNYSLPSISCFDHDELYNTAKHICQFGDLPTVRRAIRLFNCDPKIPKIKKLECIISQRMRNKIEKQNMFKKTKNQKMTRKDGKFILPFD